MLDLVPRLCCFMLMMVFLVSYSIGTVSLNMSASFDQQLRSGGSVEKREDRALELGGSCHTKNTTFPCPSNSDCVKQGNDTDDIGKCQCQGKYFHFSATHTCIPRRRPDEECSSYFQAEDPCVEGAVCRQGTCKCNPYFYAKTQEKCITLKLPGENCTESNSLCVANAYCNGTNKVCTCNENFFVNRALLCEKGKLGSGSACYNDTECVANAKCDNVGQIRQCKCLDTHYNTGDRCDKRLGLGHLCSADYKPCIHNAECIDNACQCISTAFNKSNSCSSSIHYNGTCDFFLKDPLQCEEGTVCVFRATDEHPTCACDMSHYYNGSTCLERVAVTKPCQNLTNGENQCVNNAVCNSDHICACSEGHFMRDKYCPKRLRPGATCNPTLENKDQCVDGYHCQWGQCMKNTSEDINGAIG